MSMPKGFKSKSGYGTIKKFDGKTYQEISEILTTHGHSLKHSAVRTIYIKSLMKVAKEISKLYGLNKSEEELLKIAVDADFQESIREYMSDIEASIKNNKNSSGFNI